MRVNSIKAAARTVAAGTAVAVSLGSAQAALAAPAPAALQVPCITSVLAADIAGGVSGQTLSLVPSCHYQLAAALPDISKNLTIQGNGATIERSYIPGTPAFRILTVTSGAILVLNYLNLRNGDSVGTFAAGTGNKHSAMTGISPSVKNRGYGGAIYNLNGTVTVNGGTLSNNTSSVYGGAIYSLGRLTVDRVLFVGNSSESGGAIANSTLFNPDIHQDGLESATIVTRSTFTANSAVYGGAIYMDAPMTVTQSGFTGNTSTDSGGAIYANNGYSTVTGSYFSQNRSDEYGGGIYNDSHMTVNDSSFTGNAAADWGGAIYDEYYLTVNGGTFTDNTAGYYGGGIYGDDYVTVNGGSFVGNTSEYGGGFYNDYHATVSGATFRQNEARYGGGFYNNEDATIMHSQITDNTASHAGGGIYNNENITLTTSVVDNNHPDNCAPALSVTGCTG